MGGAVSSGHNNDELIDNLKEAEYIKTLEVERVFRIVDRAHYYLPECRDSAYKDLAWKHGTLHLSAPCIYSEVMEALELKSGMSFLNLGSGTGYLNTMVGLMIGPYGINHGIELHSDNVTYAREKLESFIQTSPKFDELEFCEPEFVVGNCLNLAPENRLYDRVYCGASCPVEQKETIQNMIKINGILVIPVGDQLLKIQRLSETEFSSESVLPVSFASLVLPLPECPNANSIVLPEVDPPTLQCICRGVIRSSIRETFDFNVLESHTSHVSKPPTHHSRHTKLFRHEGGHYPLDILPTAQGLMIMGTFGHSYDDDDDDDNEEEDHDSEEEDNDGTNEQIGDLVYLHRQLHNRVSEVRRMRERLRQSGRNPTETVDSDLSCDEVEHGVTDHSPPTKNVTEKNGESTCSSLDKRNGVEQMESDSSEVRDEGECQVTNNNTNGLSSSGVDGKEKTKKGGKNGRKNENKTSGPPSASKLLQNNPYERISDRILTIMSPKSSDTLPVSESASTNKAVPTSSSIDDDDDPLPVDGVMMPKARSPAIQVTISSGNLSDPCAIKESYSTSADTSETSGFGSLGDDALHVGSHHSGLGSLNDEGELMSNDVFMPTSIPSKDDTCAMWPEDSKHTKANDDDDNDSGDTGWMDIEEEDESSVDKKIEPKIAKRRNKSDSENKNKIDNLNDFVRCKRELGFEDSDDDDFYEDDYDSIPSPRGPDFSAYLKEKVNALPLPSTLKAFILYYR